MNITMALYSTSRKIEPVELLAVLSIHWCICKVDSYKIMFFAPYTMTKLFEFQEGYIISTMVSVDMCEILRVLWGRIIKFEFSRIVCRGNRKLF